MDAKTIAFLVLLGGTPAEHVIQMQSIDDCLRAGEFVAQVQCMDESEYAEHVAESETATVSGALVAPPNPMQNMPSATQRRLRNVLNPTPVTPTTPIRRLSARKAERP